MSVSPADGSQEHNASERYRFLNNHVFLSNSTALDQEFSTTGSTNPYHCAAIPNYQQGTRDRAKTLITRSRIVVQETRDLVSTSKAWCYMLPMDGSSRQVTTQKWLQIIPF